MREILLVESGFNDGSVSPFLMVPILLSQLLSHGAAWSSSLVSDFFFKWIFGVLIYEVLIAILLSLFLGLATTKLLSEGMRRKWIERPAELSWGVMIAATVVGLYQLIGMNGFLGAFFASSASSLSEDENLRKEEKRTEGSYDYISSSLFFLVIGSTFPWSSWYHTTPWRWIVAILLIILFRRIPFLLLFYSIGALPHIKTWGEAVFIGWNGPMGVAAAFYATFAIQFGGFSTEVGEAILIIVFASIIIHGFLAIPSILLFSRFMNWEDETAQSRHHSSY